jgi:Phage integrase family
VLSPTVNGQMVRHVHFIESVWQPLLSKAGVPYRKYHATRHTYATWMLDTGADLRWVSQQMGHASLKQTADTYGHLIVDRHEATTGAIDQFLGVPAREGNGSPSARQSATPAQLMSLDTGRTPRFDRGWWVSARNTPAARAPWRKMHPR